jgi:hypothetical protein
MRWSQTKSPSFNSRIKKIHRTSDNVGINESVGVLKVKDPNVVAKLFQTNIFDQDIFQKRYLILRTQIGSLFDSDVFQSDVFQGVFDLQAIGKVFSSIFDNKIFQTLGFKKSDVGRIRDIFQSGLFDDRIFQTTVPIPKTVDDFGSIVETISTRRIRKHQLYGLDNVGVTESIVARKGDVKAINETVNVSDQLVKVFGIARTTSDNVAITEYFD